MSFDRHSLSAAIAAHGCVARVVIADIDGSTPRDVGAAMLVWADGQSGTIGGGALEWEAAARARAALEAGRDQLDRVPLGPSLGQCCGGAVTLVTELWDRERLGTTEGDVMVRPLPGTEGEMPLAVRRLLNEARSGGSAPEPGVVSGWLIEPVLEPSRALWLYGAGHVGRAIAAVIAPLPEIALTWVDTAPERFPETLPDGVDQLVSANPADVVRYAPAHADHLILTYSHELDLALCHAVLSHGFGSAGLIGSATKWSRFRKRLRQLGHADAQIDRIACPIGDPALGKHPQAIAVGVAAALLRGSGTKSAAKDAMG